MACCPEPLVLLQGTGSGDQGKYTVAPAPCSTGTSPVLLPGSRQPSFSLTRP